MDFTKFDMPKIETMAGSEEGSTFLIIAKNKKANLGIRVFLTPFKVKESIWVALGFRLRAEREGDTISPQEAVETFGTFPFYASQEHSSAVGITPLVALPCSPAEVFTHYSSYKGELETNIINQIKEKLASLNVKLIISDELIAESLREQIKDMLPELTAVTNSIPKMLWIPVK